MAVSRPPPILAIPQYVGAVWSNAGGVTNNGLLAAGARVWILRTADGTLQGVCIVQGDGSWVSRGLPLELHEVVAMLDRAGSSPQVVTVMPRPYGA